MCLSFPTLRPLLPSLPWSPSIPGGPSSPSLPTTPLGPDGPCGPLEKTQQTQRSSHQSWNWNHQEICPTYWWSSATRSSSCPWFSFLTLEKNVFQLHDRIFKPIITITRVHSSQRECSYFMSLLDHLWILSALVVLLDLEVPNTIDTIYLNYTGLSVIINLNFRHNLILTGIPGAPASPLFPSMPFCPWKIVFTA